LACMANSHFGDFLLKFIGSICREFVVGLQLTSYNILQIKTTEFGHFRPGFGAVDVLDTASLNSLAYPGFCYHPIIYCTTNLQNNQGLLHGKTIYDVKVVKIGRPV